MKYTSDKSRILSAIRGRKKGITANELMTKLNIGNRNCVYAAISTLRRDGHSITGVIGRDGTTRYSYSS